MKVIKSRNQREGKFIPGWCYNPDYRFGKADKNGLRKLIPKVRAGRDYNLIRVRGYDDNGYVIPGTTYVRYVRPGAFE